MNLTTPDLNCTHCKGKGLRARKLHLVLNGEVVPSITVVALHCSCLCPELKTLHEKLDKDYVLREWPWDELKDLRIPRAKDGPEPELLGCPFPPNFSPPPRMQIPKPFPRPAPEKKEPILEKLKRRIGRSKIKDH